MLGITMSDNSSMVAGLFFKSSNASAPSAASLTLTPFSTSMAEISRRNWVSSSARMTWLIEKPPFCPEGSPGYLRQLQSLHRRNLTLYRVSSLAIHAKVVFLGLPALFRVLCGGRRLWSVHG